MLSLYIRYFKNISQEERAERLQIQNQMCNEICKNPFPGKDAQLFLELCHFEVNGNADEEEKGNLIAFNYTCYIIREE